MNRVMLCTSCGEKVDDPTSYEKMSGECIDCFNQPIDGEGLEEAMREIEVTDIAHKMAYFCDQN